MDQFPDCLAELMTPKGPALAWGRDDQGRVLVYLREQRVTITTKSGHTYETRTVYFPLAEIQPLVQFLAEAKKEKSAHEQSSEVDPAPPANPYLAFTVS